jgi:predicted amidophosphoribosyltransferase
MKCVNCAAPLQSDGSCAYCGSLAKHSPVRCAECPGNRHRYRITQTSTTQCWYEPDTGRMVRKFRVWDDGCTQGIEPMAVDE